MATPEGWRRDVGEHCSHGALLHFRGPGSDEEDENWVVYPDVFADSDSVRIGGHDDLDDDFPMKIRTEADRDALISIIHRAWNQHVHLKECPDGPPLSEEEELS